MVSGSGARRTTLHLVRHGQSAANLERRFGGHSPTPLTELGLRQARAAAAAIRDRGPTAVVSSDLPRARQTAEPIAHACELPLSVEPALRERCLGILDDMTFEEAERRHPEHWERLLSRDPEFCPPEGEAVGDVFARVSGAVDALLAAHAGGRVVVVSHGIAIFHAMAHILGLGNPAAGARVFALVDNGSISTFVRDRGRWIIRCVNDRAHLGDSA